MDNNMKNIEFGNRLFKLREEKHWSQEYLGEKLGVSRQTVSDWERGKCRPKTDKIIKMSTLYGLTMEEILNGINETKPIEIETKVVDGNNTEIIVSDENIISSELTTVDVQVEAEVKKESFLRKHLRKIIITIAVILLLVYLGFSAYKFVILKEINDKFNEYKNVDNCYLEIKKVVTNNEIGTVYILNERYWYKDEFLKYEYIKTENGVTNTYYYYIDFEKEEIYTINKDNNKVIRNNNIENYEDIRNGILNHKIKENYHEDNLNIIKESLNICENVKMNRNKYIRISNTKEGKVERIYNKNTMFIEQLYTLNKNEEIKILYNIELNIVKDEDIQIEYIDLTNYEIMEY